MVLEQGPCVDDDEVAALLPGKEALDVASMPERLKYGRAQVFIFFVGFFSRLAMAMSFEVWPLMVSTIGTKLKISSPQGQFLASCVSIGPIITALAGGLLADRFGRKPVFIWSTVFATVMALLTPASDSYAYMVVLCVLKGLGFGISNTVSYTLIIELMPLKRRGLVMVLWHIGWPFGALLAILCSSSFLPNFRLCILFSSGGLLFLCCLLPGLLESPRWLATQGRHAEALAVVRALERWNRVPAEEAAPEPAAPGELAKKATEKEGSAAAGGAQGAFAQFLGLFKGQYLRTSLLLLLIWGCLA